ncbi:hypothetical protein [Actinoplanes sp. CA-252034]|uniref:hypothetical protein n=1 Tax=Actinoplanes sp. CA-252034 TaxID=3239906 RepID=UPI003D985DBE
MRTNQNPVRTPAPQAGRVMCADSVGRALLAMAVPPEQRRGRALSRVPVLGRRGELPEQLRRPALAADAVAEALPAAQIEQLDAEAVAEWIVGHHQSPAYPAVVLGSPHGAAVHLAVACGAAWLPTQFTVTVPWPDGSAGNWPQAMAWGTRLAERVMAHNPGVTVRQVHDPVLRGPLCGTTVSLQVRWRTLPDAYRRLLRSRLTADGTVVLVRDLRTWPVLSGPAGYTFQIGSPTAGWAPADYGDDDAVRRLLRRAGADDWVSPPTGMTRQYAETSGEASLEPELRRIAAETGHTGHRMFYTDPQAFSGAVADLYRSWLHPRHREWHAVVSTGRLTDPWLGLDTGIVPYWCESSSRAATEAAELWLAGVAPFDRISVLPEPPGSSHEKLASMVHWRSIAAFAGRGGMVDELIASRYPMLPTPAGHATRFFRYASMEYHRPEPLPVGDAVRHIARNATLSGLIVV